MKDKNFMQARQVLTDAMRQHPEAASDVQFYRYQMDALNELIGVENRKIYLHSKPDTAAYFNYIYDIYETGLKCDSLEQTAIRARQAEGKKAAPKYRAGVGHMLVQYRKNLLNAGKYYYNKKDYSNAYRFLHMYAQTKQAVLFLDNKGETIVSDPDDMKEVAVLSVLSAYASDHHGGVMTYLDESLQDEELKPQLLELGSKASAALGDTATMVQLLEQGFHSYPDSEYFLVTLVKHYNDKGMFEQAWQKAHHMTELHPNKRDYWYMEGKELMLMGKNNEALTSFQKCVDIKADDAESFSAIGNIYLYEAHDAYSRFDLPLSDPNYTIIKKAISDLYKKSCAAFEQARKFDENNHDLWLQGLREAYFKLNKGKELRALEKYK